MAENSTDTLWDFGYGCDAGQEVAIADIALLDVCRVDVVLDEFCIAYDFGYALPDYFTVVYGEI